MVPLVREKAPLHHATGETNLGSQTEAGISPVTKNRFRTAKKNF
jgi:hypothetical protein